MSNELPPLPHPHMSSGVAHYHSGFTYAQMREYGRACERAAYERAAQECESRSGPIESYNLAYRHYLNCAAAIRALGADK